MNTDDLLLMEPADAKSEDNVILGVAHAAYEDGWTDAWDAQRLAVASMLEHWKKTHGASVHVEAAEAILQEIDRCEALARELVYEPGYVIKTPNNDDCEGPAQ